MYWATTAEVLRERVMARPSLYDGCRTVAKYEGRRTMNSMDHPSRDEIELPAVLHALSDPVRLGMVRDLAAAGECPCRALNVAVTKSTATHHFKVLREAGLIQQRQQGTARLNSLRADDLEARFPGLLRTILAAA
jgi:DNA-binding transcriptional ArsR family regulator